VGSHEEHDTPFLVAVGLEPLDLHFLVARILDGGNIDSSPCKVYLQLSYLVVEASLDIEGEPAPAVRPARRCIDLRLRLQEVKGDKQMKRY
jgi:hypothetical protein